MGPSSNHDSSSGGAAPTVPLSILVAPEVENVCHRLEGLVQRHGFVLCGGTALGTYLGHRKSNDLDFFRSDGFDEQSLINEIRGSGILAQLLKSGIESQQLLLDLEGAKVEFVAWRGLDTTRLRQISGSGLMVPELDQLAVMKTRAAATRGKKRDIVDLYFLLLHGFDPAALVLAAADEQRPVAVKFAKSISLFDRRNGYEPSEQLHMIKQVDLQEMTSVVKREFAAAVFL